MRYLFLILFLSFNLFCKGQVKMVEYTGTGDVAYAMSSSTYISQWMVNGSECSFTNYFPTSFKLTHIKLLLYRSGSTGNVTVTIRRSFEGCPNGTILSSGSVNVSFITTNTVGEWITIDMSECELFKTLRYIITVTHSLPTATLHWKTHTYSSPCMNYEKLCEAGSPSFNQTTQTIYEAWGNAIGSLMFDTKYGSKQRVLPYGNKYDSKNELYIYDTHYE